VKKRTAPPPSIPAAGSWNIMYAMIRDAFESSDIEAQVVGKSDKPI
jgi:hypothetical protein